MNVNDICCHELVWYIDVKGRGGGVYQVEEEGYEDHAQDFAAVGLVGHVSRFPS
jgi:hypothetical protein